MYTELEKLKLLNHKFDAERDLYSVAQIRELDRIVIEECGISGYELMQRAGRFSYETLKKTWPECNKIAVICGCGNNAGDGYVLAKLAIEDGKDVRILNCFDSDLLKGDAKRVYQELLTLAPDPVDDKSPFNDGCHDISNYGCHDISFNIDSGDDLSLYPYTPYTVESRLTEGQDSNTGRPYVFVDAIFGTGLTRDVHRELELIWTLNSLKEDVDIERKILSIDIPSGLNADTGNVMGGAVKADVTATFMGKKRGMYTQGACEYLGQIVFNDLDIPRKSYQQLGKPDCCILDYHDYESRLKLNARKRNSHKGDFGHVLVIGGDEGYLGASLMTAEAAMRVGSGLVSVATRKSHAAQMSIAVPEIMSHGVESLDELMSLIKRATVIAIGPGLGQSEWAKLLFARVLESDLPIIIDADGLNLLAEEEQSSRNWVITPHPGEAARLLKTDVTTIQSDRFQSTRNLHTKYQGVVVLKGAGSIVTDLQGNLYVCNEGNPGMSTGGMGDVLTGVIAGLVAQGIDIERATQAGVFMHARAADMAASSGERGMVATDLMPYLRELANPE